MLWSDGMGTPTVVPTEFLQPSQLHIDTIYQGYGHEAKKNGRQYDLIAFHSFWRGERVVCVQ